MDKSGRWLVLSVHHSRLNFRVGNESSDREEQLKMWGCSSAGRAPALQAGGQEFDSPHLHHPKGKADEGL